MLSLPIIAAKFPPSIISFSVGESGMRFISSRMNKIFILAHNSSVPTDVNLAVMKAGIAGLLTREAEEQKIIVSGLNS